MVHMIGQYVVLKMCTSINIDRLVVYHPSSEVSGPPGDISWAREVSCLEQSISKHSGKRGQTSVFNSTE